MTVYIQALKKFNEGKKYTIPKKGTDDYNSVMQIMRTLQSFNFTVSICCFF